MPFYADLHIHSKYSRATSRTCDLEHLHLWACKKGVRVVATGDFTHPQWLDELREKLLPAEPGLFRLRGDLESAVTAQIPASCRTDTRFMLSVEISTIYKRGPRTRKVHHVIYVPGFEHADKLVAALSRIGNLKADGRPILGLDSRDLLEIVLETGEGAYLVPAHIWTPWFSALGSKSGFDSIEECYGELSGHIPAVETGLSSDPAMNWRLSSLDKYRLVSNSDAHSPKNMGRNACVFDCGTDYFAMLNALRTGQGYGGTVEFYPEKGKYHLDGHRKCDARLEPRETLARDALCPVCGKPVTVGVMHRVEALADRQPGERRPDADPFRSLIPLPEILSEIEGVGAQSKRVGRLYEQLLERFGPELPFLEHAPLDQLARHASDILVEALRRMRAGQVIREAGYDGDYGRIRLFEDAELTRGKNAGLLFPIEELVADEAEESRAAEAPAPYQNAPSQPARTAPAPAEADAPAPPSRPKSILDALDACQRAAAETTEGPLLIVAGPGTGKTRTLTHRLAHLVAERGVDPERCLAITFTRRAAEEMRERLESLIPGLAARITVCTFHRLGLDILREHAAEAGLASDFRVADENEQLAALMSVCDCTPAKARQWLHRVSARRRTAGEASDPELDALCERYARALQARGLVDFDDLIALPAALLEADAAIGEEYRRRFAWVSVDEYQDLDALQYRLIRLLAPPHGNICVIGDPNQAIYRFRGGDVRFFNQFREDYPAARTAVLDTSYRCGRNILDASSELVASLDPERARLAAFVEHPERVMVHESPTDKAEAEFVVKTIESLVGGHSFFSLDTERSGGHEEFSVTFGGIAVLYRTDAQAAALCEALGRSGIPFQRHSHRRLLDDPVARHLAGLMRADGASGSVAERLRSAADRFVQAAEATDDNLGPSWAWGEAEPDGNPGDVEQLAAAALGTLEPLALRYGDDLGRFLDDLTLGADLDEWDERAERVSLLTLHAAKGLEFDAVFLTGCEDSVLPLSWRPKVNEADRDEERRLFYVGMTRARRRLILSHARRRRWRGKVRPMSPSPFLADFAESLLEHRTAELPTRRIPKAAQLELFGE